MSEPVEAEKNYTNFEELPEDVRANVLDQLLRPAALSEQEVAQLTEEMNVAKASAAAANAEGPWANLKEVDVNSKGKNNCELVCPFCRKSSIILANTGVFVEQEIFLMYPHSKNATEGKIYTKFYKLTNKMDFENITVKRAVADSGFRYLTCGDCEIGPVGITFDADNNKVFYISHDRVLYK